MIIGGPKMTTPYQYGKQIRTVFLLEALVCLLVISVASGFVYSFCSESVLGCFFEESFTTYKYILLALIRPFFLVIPQYLLSYLALENFFLEEALFLILLGNLVSTLIVYTIAKLLGRLIVKPWFISNIPESYGLISRESGKLILVGRLFPFVPFDLSSFIFGLLNFRLATVLTFTFLASVWDMVVLVGVFTLKAEGVSSSFFLGFVLIVILAPVVTMESLCRLRGVTLIRYLYSFIKEAKHEVAVNNSIISKKKHDLQKLPVLLLYGFFSSRRSLTILERNLTYRGYEVLCFNLGGVFGFFFTKGIIESAKFLDERLKEFFHKYKYSEIQIIAHSKGGLVALWWLLCMKGHKHCKKIITLGAPFHGSNFTWLGLITPLGYIFRDLWQMRPGSSVLKTLGESEIPDRLEIYNVYSRRDKVVIGRDAVFQPVKPNEQIHPIAAHDLGHFDYLYSREMASTLSEVLGSPYIGGEVADSEKDSL